MDCERAGEIEAFDVLHAPTAIADEVMMTMNFGVEAGGRAFQNHLAHQAAFISALKLRTR